jgi:hypothetical protein
LKILPSITRKTISLFLAFILTAATLTAFFPSSMIDAYAIKDIEKNKIESNNINLNLNGLDIEAVPEPLSSLLQSQGETEDVDIGTGAFANGENKFGYDKDFAFICKNNNNNTFIVSPTSTPSTPPPPPPIDTETLTVIKNVDCQEDTVICEEIPSPPTNSGGINQQAAMNFIKNSYNPSVQMLEEAPEFSTFWLWNDQLLGQIILKHIDPTMATTIENKMNSFGVTMRTPWATLDPKYRGNFSVNTPSEPTIQAGEPAIRYSDYNGSTELSVNDYADIAFLSAIHHYYNNNMTLAQQAYDAGRAMWNRQGMDDAGNITGEYAVYKVALGMLAEKITGFTPIGIPSNWFAPFQNANGGITTDKTGGVPSGSQNIETTVAVLLAINPSLLTNP